jgi:hypothetical protein
MKFRLVTVVAAAAALSLAAAGSAAAQPPGHKPVPPPQVSGSKLQAALLPAAAFGPGFTRTAHSDTGPKLDSTHATKHIPSLSCSYFESHGFFGFLGDTAGALSLYTNPDARATYPDSVAGGYEDVLQFATAASATAIYNQARAKYVACRSFTEPAFGVTASVSTVSVANTKVSGYRAFVVTESASLSGFFIRPLYFNVLYVVAGTNVYSLWDYSGTNDEPFPALMRTLIHRIQALYPHH